MEGERRPLRQRVGSFFTSVTGLLTATAAFLGAIVGILSAVGVIGASSHGGSNASASAQAPTPASWAARANAVCAREADATSALPDPHTIAPSDAAGYLRTAAIFERRMLRELNALPTPQGEQAAVADFLKVGAQMSDATSELADDAALRNLPGLVRRARELSQLNTHFNNVAVALGARTCAEGSSLADIFGSG